MKKIIITALNFLVLLSVNAQGEKDLPTSIIIHGGLNLSGMEATDVYFVSNANPGFSGGVLLRSDGDLFLIGGFQYVSINPTLTDKNDALSEKVTLQYAQIPFMIGMHFVKSPDVSRCVHGQIGGSFTSLLDVSDNNLGIEKDNIKQGGFNFKVGVGADLWRFVVDVHYNLLVTHLYDFTGYNNKTRLMCWEFSVGMKINFRGKNHVEE